MLQNSSFKLKHKNCHQQTTSAYDCVIDEDKHSVLDKIPKMELLKVNYVNFIQNSTNPNNCQRSSSSVELKRASAPSTSSSSSSLSNHRKTKSIIDERRRQNLSKYSVYKKYNGPGLTTQMLQIQNKPIELNSLTTKDDSLKYQNDDELNTIKNRRRLALFEGRKKDKLENIQFYFDNKSYERYVDNKLYGVIGGEKLSEESEDFASKLNSWDYRRSNALRGGDVNAKISSYSNTRQSFNKKTDDCSESLLYNKFNDSVQLRSSPSSLTFKQGIVSRENQMSDVEKITQMFNDVRRCSLDQKLQQLKITDESDKRCSCNFDTRNESKVRKTNVRRNNSNLPLKEKDVTTTTTTTVAAKRSDRPNNNNNESNEKIHLKLKQMFEEQHRLQNFEEFDQKNTKKKSNFINSNNSLHLINEMEKSIKNFDVIDNGFMKTTTCGYKNCTFSNCPMMFNTNSPPPPSSSSSESSLSSSAGSTTTSSSSSSSSTTSESSSLCCEENLNKQVQKESSNIFYNNSNTQLTIFTTPLTTFTNEINSKTNTSKTFITNNKIYSSNDDKLIIVDEKSKNRRITLEEECDKYENFSTKNSDNSKNFEFNNKNIKSNLTIEKLMSNKNVNNLLEQQSSSQQQIIQRNRNDDNCVKIFISNSKQSDLLASILPSLPPLTSITPSQQSNYTDKDYCYADQVSVSADSKEMVNNLPPLDSVNSSVVKLGSDGAIFWNNCYYYDEKQYDCSRCIKKDEKYICVCTTDVEVNYVL